MLGGRVGQYVFDRVQVEGGVGWTHVKRPQEIVESLFGLSLEAEDLNMLWFRSGSDDSRVENNNIEFTLGTAALF